MTSLIALNDRSVAATPRSLPDRVAEKLHS